MANNPLEVNTDFFDRQRAAQKKSRLLVACFLLMLPLVVFSTYLVLYFIPCFAISDSRMPVEVVTSGDPLDWKNFKVQRFPLKDMTEFTLHGHDLSLLAPKPLIRFGGLIGLGFLLAAAWSGWRLSQGGGEYIAEKLGAEPPEQQGRDIPKLKRLRNSLEEMAVAAGIPCPELYILPQEEGINALAAGRDQDDVAIILTQGAVNILENDELQAVLAHELAHVVNYDFKINTQMAVTLSGLMALMAVGRNIMRLMPNHLGAVLGSLFYLAGFPGFALGGLIQFGFSRQREHLADSMAIQFTRNPAALASALKKIGGFPWGGRIQSGQAFGHNTAFITSPNSLADFLQTHPSLESRIWNIEENWDGVYPEVKPVKYLQGSPLGESVSNIFKNLE